VKPRLDKQEICGTITVVAGVGKLAPAVSQPEAESGLVVAAPEQLDPKQGDPDD
jgi:hypothetical protein